MDKLDMKKEFKELYKAKKEDKDFVVMPLEGNWWAEPEESFSLEEKDGWLWEMMIALPPFVTSEIVEEAKENLKKKKNPESLDKVSFKQLTDGLSVQFLYTGSYSDEAPYIQEMHDIAYKEGYKLRGQT